MSKGYSSCDFPLFLLVYSKRSLYSSVFQEGDYQWIRLACLEGCSCSPNCWHVSIGADISSVSYFFTWEEIAGGHVLLTPVVFFVFVFCQLINILLSSRLGPAANIVGNV